MERLLDLAESALDTTGKALDLTGYVLGETAAFAVRLAFLNPIMKHFFDQPTRP